MVVFELSFLKEKVTSFFKRGKAVYFFPSPILDMDMDMDMGMDMNMAIHFLLPQ